MELKQYQQRVLDAVSMYLNTLDEESKTAAAVKEALAKQGKSINYNVTDQAWIKLG